MITITNEPIPENRMQQWHELLCDTDGRYLSNPRYNAHAKEYRVDYIPGDYERQCNVWNLLTTPIKETKRFSLKQFIRKLFN